MPLLKCEVHCLGSGGSVVRMGLLMNTIVSLAPE